jgi:GT2 family glycosyltransferase
MNHIKRAAILMTVHNRKEKTLKCLTNLYVALQHVNSEPRTVFDVYITDDGSTDGTRDDVLARYPQVRFIEGNGILYWNRGMLAAWKYALSENDYDGFFWLNNDSYLYPDAFSLMFEAISPSPHLPLSRSSALTVFSGAFISETTGQASFGGRINDRILTPNGEWQKFDQLNGNFVFVPKSVVEKIGLLDGVFHHGIGDYDYGYRARKAGIELLLTPRYIGVCERDSDYHKYRDPRFSMVERFRFLYSPLGPPPVSLFRYNFRHFSFFKALSVFVYINLVCLCPGIRKLFNKH